MCGSKLPPLASQLLPINAAKSLRKAYDHMLGRKSRSTPGNAAHGTLQSIPLNGFWVHKYNWPKGTLKHESPKSPSSNETAMPPQYIIQSCRL